MANHDKNQAGGCNQGMGVLPACAPLANPYVPYQQQDPETYQASTGLIRGTMFPALDLPFMGMVNQTEKNKTALNRLQNLHFAISELGLYLDTHQEDRDALELFNQYVEQYADAMQKYEDARGPLVQMSSGLSGSYRWTEGPWPWDYDANQEG